MTSAPTERIVDRVQGPVAATTAVIVLLLVDIVLGPRGYISVGLTALQSMLVLPWAIKLFRVDHEDRDRPFWRRLRLVAVHVVTVLLVAICLAEKGIVLYEVAKRTRDVGRYIDGYRTYSAGASVFFLIGFFARGSRLGRFLGAVAEHPARLMALSFGLASTLGGFTLTLPQALRRIDDASFIDGFFTATSAVCITGLSVVDIARTYSFFGQVVILALVQVGGLGIMVLSSFFGLLAGTRMRVRSSAVLAQMIDADSLATIKRSVRSIVLFTLFFECLGMLVLGAYFLVVPPPGVHGAGDLAFKVVFHSVNAFCNAGFSLFPDSFAPFAKSWVPCLAIMGLSFFGGVGFPVLDEFYRRFREKLAGRRPPRLSLHARVVLATNAALFVFMALAFAILEWKGALHRFPWHARVLGAFFHSVNARSGGYATVDLGLLHPATVALLCLVMFVGASPGGTGGGIKTTTFATLLATFRAEVIGEKHARLFDRRPTEAMVRRAIGVAFLATTLLSVVVIALFVVEPHAPLALAFEATSAFATVGLSTGITPELSNAGKLILIFAMFVGRIGPLTFALAIAMRARHLPYELPEERFTIG